MTFIQGNSAFFKDADGFGRPDFGGTVAVKYATVAYTDTTAKNLFALPAGAVVTDIKVNVTTAFTDSGTDLLAIGLDADADYFATAVSVVATGLLPAETAGFVPSRLFGTALTAEGQVTATFTGQNANAGAGLATVAISYILM